MEGDRGGHQQDPGRDLSRRRAARGRACHRDPGRPRRPRPRHGRVHAQAPQPWCAPATCPMRPEPGSAGSGSISWAATFRPCSPGDGRERLRRGGGNPARRNAPRLGGLRAVSTSPAWSNFESARVRIDPSGDVLVHSGMSTQGQGQATTFAQIAADVLGADVDRVSVALGDTALLSFGRGAFASRGAIMGGSAVFEAATASAGTGPPDCGATPAGRGRRTRHRRRSHRAADRRATPGLRSARWPARVAPGGPLFDGGAGLEAETVWRADRPATLAFSVHVARVAVDPRNRFGRGRGLCDRPRYRTRAQPRDRRGPGRGRSGRGDRQRAACRDGLLARRPAAYPDARRLPCGHGGRHPPLRV